MSSSTPTPLTDEAGVERAVRSILFPLNQQLESGNQWGCSLFGLVLAPLVFLGLWWWLGWSWYVALASGLVGSFLLWIAFWVWYDGRVAGLAAAVFDRQFPPGHPDRELAIRMLSEMQYPTLAHEKLRAALNAPSRP